MNRGYRAGRWVRRRAEIKSDRGESDGGDSCRAAGRVDECPVESCLSLLLIAA